jgi:hypothetical protein
VQALQPRLLHKPQRPSNLHTLPDGLLHWKGRTRQVQGLPQGNLYREDSFQALHQVPYRVLLVLDRSQQVYVLPARFVHELNRGHVMRAVSRRNLFHSVRRGLKYHLRGVSRRFVQLQAWINGMYHVSCGSVHGQDTCASLQGLPARYVQYVRGQFAVFAVQVRVYDVVHGERRCRSLQRQGAAGW